MTKKVKGKYSLSFIQMKSLAQETADEFRKTDENRLVAMALTKFLVKVAKKLDEENKEKANE